MLKSPVYFSIMHTAFLNHGVCLCVLVCVLLGIQAAKVLEAYCFFFKLLLKDVMHWQEQKPVGVS